MKPTLLLTASHLAVLAIGFALGIYLLPILTAPPPPAAGELQQAAQGARYQAQFVRALKGSDALHWGEGRVALSPTAVSFTGAMAPGPAYKLYLVPEFVETEADFQRVQARSVALGDIKTFDSFIVPVPPGVRLEDHTTVLVWCEAFSQFITAAKYR